jgi:cytochrome b6-f complex iron-sulfur subunit
VRERSEDRVARRVDRVVSDLLAGRRLETGAGDASEQAAIRRASQLAASSLRTPHMTAAFREHLAAQLSPAAPPRRITRRVALAAAFSAAGGVALGTALDRIAGMGSPGAAQPEAPWRAVVTPASAASRWIEVGLALDDLEEGIPVRASAGAIGVFVVRRGQTVTAVSALCTHQPCELVWNQAGQALDCPCHGARFGVDGSSLSQDYPYPLPPLPLAQARVRAGRVEVLGTDTGVGR